MKKMKLKKKVRFKFKNIGMTVLLIISFFIGIKIFLSFQVYSSNEEFILSLLNNSSHYRKHEKENKISNLINSFFNIKLEKPISLLENMFNITEYESISDIKLTNYINNNDSENPIAYIYNTHQLENYINSNKETYNITPNVLMASYLLKEKLNEYNIPAIVEETNIPEILKINNWNYSYSYKASRFLIEDAIAKNKQLKYFIDIHRDSIPYNSSTIKIKNINYARVLFVIGKENKNYKKNLDLSNRINEKFKKLYPGLSRGIILKEGPMVDGIYNQDLSPNLILIEVGGYQNKIEEVQNTINVFSEILREEIIEKK